MLEALRSEVGFSKYVVADFRCSLVCLFCAHNAFVVVVFVRCTLMVRAEGKRVGARWTEYVVAVGCLKLFVDR